MLRTGMDKTVNARRAIERRLAMLDSKLIKGDIPNSLLPFMQVENCAD